MEKPFGGFLPVKPVAPTPPFSHDILAKYRDEVEKYYGRLNPDLKKAFLKWYSNALGWIDDQLAKLRPKQTRPLESRAMESYPPAIQNAFRFLARQQAEAQPYMTANGLTEDDFLPLPKIDWTEQ